MAKKRRKKAEPRSRGLTAAQATGAAPAAVRALEAAIEEDGGRPLGSYRDPLGGSWQTFAMLPIEKVERTPFQRDVSEAHAKRLAARIEEVGRFLDPILAVRRGDGTYWTPNGGHRLVAMRELGARAITALVVPEEEIAFRILALNTEKAHNLREKSLEVVRMARELAALDPRPEREFADFFEEPAFLTLGCCYERNGRFAGGAYHPVLKRIEAFLGAKLPSALQTREERAAKLLELDEAVNDAVKALKERGFESQYLKPFVVARVNPLRFQRGAKADWDETVGKMLRSARRFDAGKIRPEHVARSGGPASEE